MRRYRSVSTDRSRTVHAEKNNTGFKRRFFINYSSKTVTPAKKQRIWLRQNATNTTHETSSRGKRNHNVLLRIQFPLFGQHRIGGNAYSTSISFSFSSNKNKCLDTLLTRDFRSPGQRKHHRHSPQFHGLYYPHRHCWRGVLRLIGRHRHRRSRLLVRSLREGYGATESIIYGDRV